MPFTSASVLPDGSGATFYDPATKRRQTLYGADVVKVAERLPSMATSEEALAQALPGPVDQAAEPEPVQIRDVPQTPRPPAPGAAPAAGPAPVDRFGLPTDVKDPIARARLMVDRFKGRLAGPAAPAAPAASGSGGGDVGIGDVGGSGLPQRPAAPSLSDRFPGLDEGMGNFDTVADFARSELATALLPGATPRTKAGFIPTSTKTVTEGVASPETVAGINAAYGAREQGVGQQAAAAAGGDRAQANAYQAGAADVLAALQQLQAATARSDGAAEKLAGQLEEDGQRSPLKRLEASFDGTLAQLMAINLGQNAAGTGAAAGVQSYLDRTQAARKGAADARIGAADRAGKNALAGVDARGAATTAQVKAGELSGRAEGRAGEAEAAQAQLELERLGLLGKREAALMGTTESSAKYQQAGGGGPDWRRAHAAAALLQSTGAAQVGAGATRGAAAKAPAPPPSFVIGDRRVVVDPALAGTPILAKMYDQVQDLNALASAQAQLKAAWQKLGAKKFLPGSKGYSEDYQEYLTAVKGVARIKSQLQRAGTINPGEEPTELGQFTNPLVAGGAIKSVDDTLRRTRENLARQVSGQLWPSLRTPTRRRSRARAPKGAPCASSTRRALPCPPRTGAAWWSTPKPPTSSFSPAS